MTLIELKHLVDGAIQNYGDSCEVFVKSFAVCGEESALELQVKEFCGRRGSDRDTFKLTLLSKRYCEYVQDPDS